MSIPNTDLSIYELDKIFKKSNKIFFIGIGGISMSSLAEYCVKCGKEVYGYDRTRGKICERLEKICHMQYYSTPDSVAGMDLIVYTGAMNPSNFEYKSAKQLGIPTVSRANFLGYIMSSFNTRIGVSGMHGKSTTTSMLSHIFAYAKKDPVVFCGAEMTENASSFRYGGKDYIIFEACEYMNSFLNFYPTDAVVTNIDFDHPDFFSSMGEIISSFNKYICVAGAAYINADDIKSTALKHPNKITYAIDNDAVYKAKILSAEKENRFAVYKNGKNLCECTISLLGKHNVYNALCAFSVAHEKGIEPNTIKEALYTFQGSKRRMEFLRISNTGAHIFMDYAHHPTEIKASISSFKQMGFNDIVCIFQSHTYSRTYSLYEEFTKAFKGVKKLIVTPIYPAREKNIYPITDEGFAKDCGGMFMSDYKEISKFVSSYPADCVIIMGAGDIDGIKNYLI